MRQNNRDKFLLVVGATTAVLIAAYYLAGSREAGPEPQVQASGTSTAPATQSAPYYESRSPPDEQRVEVATGSVPSGPATRPPVAESAQLTRLTRTDADYRFLAAGLRMSGAKVPDELRLSAARAAELRSTIEPYRVRADAVLSELNDRLFQASRAIVANGGGEYYSVDDPNTKRSVAKRIAPHNAEQNVVYVSHNGGNYVVRFDPGQDTKVDSFNAALRTEYIECVHLIRRRFPDLFPPQ